MNGLRKFVPPAFATAFVFGVFVYLTQDSSALTVFDGMNAAKGAGQPSELFGDGGIITKATNVLLFVVGALSVIMVIFGGLRYVVSGGNSAAVTAAKNTVLYAIVGLVVAFVAYAGINFVINSLAPGAGAAGFTNT